MTWRAAAAADDLWEGELAAVQLAGQDIVLVNVGGEIRAYEDRCPHRGFKLSAGDLAGQVLTCVNHRWEFDALTGAGTNPANCQLTAFGTRVRNGQIEIRAPGPE
jgi:toluene monooxygenase system ferredoxin subunit